MVYAISLIGLAILSGWRRISTAALQEEDVEPKTLALPADPVAGAIEHMNFDHTKVPSALPWAAPG